MYRFYEPKRFGRAVLTWALWLLWIVVWAVFPGHGIAQQLQVFQLQTQGCPGATPLDFLELQGQTSGDGGKVTVRVAIDANGSAHASVLQSAERSGPEEFWNHVRQVISTWCFSPNAVAAGHLDYTVVVNPRSQGGGGFVEISARDLVLAEGWTLDIAHGAKLAHVQNIDLGNIMVVESPPSIHLGGSKGFRGSAEVVWGQLGGPFQLTFVVLFFLFVVFFVRAGLRTGSWTRPGPPSEFFPWIPWAVKTILGGIRDGGQSLLEYFGLREGRNEELKQNFGSVQAQEIRGRWIKAMEISQLEPGSVPPVQETTIRALDELVEYVDKSARTLEEISSKAKDLRLTGKKGIFESSEFTQSGLSVALGSSEKLKRGKRETRSAAELRLEARRLIVERREWAKLYLKQLQLGSASLQPDEARRLRALTWEHFARSLVESAHRQAKKLADQGIDLFEVFEAGLSNHLVNRNEWWASQEIDRSVDRSLSVKLDARKSVLDPLWAIGAVAPLVGLFGTVWGISRAFGRIQNIQETQLRMAKLSGDINVALSTTIVGLIIGIGAFLSYYWFKGKSERTAAAVAKYFTDITNRA